MATSNIQYPSVLGSYTQLHVHTGPTALSTLALVASPLPLDQLLVPYFCSPLLAQLLVFQYLSPSYSRPSQYTALYSTQASLCPR